jgi:hypothetical protein
MAGLGTAHSCVDSAVSSIGTITHAALTEAGLQFASQEKECAVDIIFVLVIAVLYAVTHWLVWAIDRIRSPQ